jgi:hypothetical protein
VVFSFSRPAGTVLVFELNPDNPPPVFPEEPVQLLAYLDEEAPDISKVSRIVLANRGLGDQPVGKPSIADFAMVPKAPLSPRRRDRAWHTAR